MGVSVKVAYDNLPEGAEVEIPYLGLFENGSTREVDDVRWDRFLRVQPGAAARYSGATSVEFGTQQAQEDSEAQAALREAVIADDEDDAKTLDDYKKDELVEMARTAGVDSEGLTKAQLIEALEKTAGGQTIPDESQEG